MRIFQINPIHLRQPSAGREEILPQVFHHQVDGAHGIPHANIAAAAVPPRVEREAGVMVIMKGAECLVPLHLYPHLLRNPLYRQVAQFLNFIFLHKNYFFTLSLILSRRYSHQIFPCLRIKPRLGRIGDEFAVFPYVKLMLGALLALAKAQAESFQL